MEYALLFGSTLLCTITCTLSLAGSVSADAAGLRGVGLFPNAGDIRRRRAIHDAADEPEIADGSPDKISRMGTLLGLGTPSFCRPSVVAI
jgi:hypothetical protein